MIKKSEDKDKYAIVLASLVKESYSVRIPVYGLSMFPFFLPGDEVVVVSVNKNQPMVGDVVFFRSGKGVVAHRVIRIKENVVVTKGDGLLKRDSLFEINEVLGVVIKHYRKGNEINYSKHKQLNRIIAFISPLIGFIFFPCARIWNKYLR